MATGHEDKGQTLNTQGQRGTLRRPGFASCCGCWTSIKVNGLLALLPDEKGVIKSHQSGKTAPVGRHERTDFRAQLVN